MARRKPLIKFNGALYIEDLRSAIYHAIGEAGSIVEERARQNLNALSFKTNEVKLADGTITSDAQRKGDVLASISKSAVEYYAGKQAKELGGLNLGYKSEKSTAKIEVRALGAKNYAKSHVGLYYEYGTGEEEDVPRLRNLGIHLGDPNIAARTLRTPGTGQPVVSRGRKKGSSGLWKDAGGNVRRAAGAGGRTREESPGFSNYIGPDIAPANWFHKAFADSKDEIRQLLAEAMRSVNPLSSKYFIT